MPDDATSAPVATPSPANAGDSPSPASSPPSEADVSAALDSLGELSSEQLQAIDGGDFSGLMPAGDKAPEPKGDKAAEPETSTPQGDKDPANIHRIGLGGLPPEARAKLVKFTTLVKSGMSEAEASAQVYGIATPKGAEPGKEAEAEPEAAKPAPVPEAVATIEQSIADTKAEIARVKAEYGDTTDLMERLSDLKLDLREAKREAERASATQATFQSEVAKSLDKVMEQNADLWTDVKPGQEKSAFESFCDDEFLLAEAKSDPVLQRPNWPEHIAKRVLDKFFQGRSANSAGYGDDDPTIPPLPNQQVRLPGSLTGNTDAPGVLTPGNIMAQFDTLTEDQQLEVLKRAGG